VDELAVEFDGRAKVLKCDTSQNFDTAVNFGIRMLPTLLLFKGGQPVQQLVGFQAKEQLAKLLDDALAG
jgi:thioredoxin 1